jgi:hypothetical protein
MRERVSRAAVSLADFELPLSFTACARWICLVATQPGQGAFRCN